MRLVSPLMQLWRRVDSSLVCSTDAHTAQLFDVANCNIKIVTLDVPAETSCRSLAGIAP
jgi:hypothetical protein